MTPRTAVPRGKEKANPAPSSIERHWSPALAVLFLFALGWRLAYLGRLAASPLAESLRADERQYWDWATYLLGHGFRGTNPFFLGPLYPHVLALVRAVVGSDAGNVLRVQALWSSAAVVMLTDAARRLSRPSVALGLGIVLALYPMSVFFDGLILMESLLFFLEALLLWLWCRACGPTRRGIEFLAIALVTGLIAQCRATGALLLIPGLWLAARAGATPRRAALRRVGGMLALFVLTMFPAAAWNGSASHEFIPFTYNFGFNLYIGNNPAANGAYIWPTRGTLGTTTAESPDGGTTGDGRQYLQKARGLSLSAARSSEYWAHEAAIFMRRSPALALALAGKKLLMLWNYRETPQIDIAELFRQMAGPLGLPLLGSFAFLAVLGLVGFACAESGSGIGLAIRLYVLLVTVGTLPFFVTDRYRVHLVPALILLSAVGVEAFLRRRRARPRQSVRTMVFAALGAAFIVGLPILDSERDRERWLVARDLGARWLEHGRIDLAIRELERAIRLERSLQLDRDPDPSTLDERAMLHFDYGAALHHVGRDDDALIWLRAATQESPETPQYLRTLGDAYLVQGREREGDSLLRRVSSMVGGTGQALLSNGWKAARAGKLEEAEELFRRAIESDVHLYGAWTSLIRVQVQRGEGERARATVLSAAQTGMPQLTLKAHEALVDAALGDSIGARRALEQIPREAIDRDATLMRVVTLARHMLEGRTGPGGRRSHE